MTVELTPDAERLLAARMLAWGVTDPGEMLLVALAGMVDGPDIDDEELLDASDRATADYEAGRCLTIDQVRAQMHARLEQR